MSHRPTLLTSIWNGLFEKDIYWKAYFNDNRGGAMERSTWFCKSLRYLLSHRAMEDTPSKQK